jgi:hydrophobic/amphiphilic exporter-1 (mainly G- bacteria), HAE1 family
VLSRAAIARPVATISACILVLVMAAAAFLRVPVTLLPDLRYPALLVWTGYPDVPPDRVERTVTERIEEAVAGTAGLHGLTARSQLGGSLVRLDFGWNTNLDLALLDVREQLDRLGDALPDNAARPVVLRLDPSERPIMMLAMREAVPDSDVLRAQLDAPQDLVGLKQIAREVVSRRLEQLDGVARVRVTGGHECTVDVIVDPARLAAHGVGIDQIGAVLRSANVALPGGMIRRGPFQYAVEVSGEFKEPVDVAATVITPPGDVPIRLSDVAEVRESVAERRGLVRFDGAESLLLLVERRPDANIVRTSEQVRAALHELETELSGASIHVVVDESVFIRQAIGGVTQAVLLGGLLAVIVLFVFLRRPRALAAVAIAVPLSLALTLVLFDLFGISFNLISLSGLALGVGMLVDNAIVVVENIARLRERGMAALDAAREGASEVAGAITASTLTTIAVFLPLTFVEGLAGRLFRDQSMAVVCSLLASLLMALTVVPLVASRERPRVEGRGAPDGGRMTARLLASYERGLAWSLSNRAVVGAAVIVLLVVSGALTLHLPREVIPQADQGRVELRMGLPPGADLSVVDDRAMHIQDLVSGEGYARHVLADVGERDEARLDLDPRPPYEAELVLILPDGARARNVLRQLRAQPVPSDVELDVRPVRTQLEALLAPGDADLYLDLVSDERRFAERALPHMLDALHDLPELANVRLADANEVPAYRLTFDRDNLARFGVSPQALGPYLEAAARGRRATELRTINEEIPILVRSRAPGTIDRLLEERVPTAGGLMPLRTFVRADQVMLPAGLTRTGQAPVIRIYADVAPGSDLGRAARAIEREGGAVLPADVRLVAGGSTDAFRSSLRAVMWSILLSLLLGYLILAAKFESLVQPLVVLAAVPLAAAGVAVVLLITGQTLNLMSLTGCVVLIGIVVNDAIIKVDFINQRRVMGMPLHASIMAAGHDRARPIIMTTVTTALGLLPLTLGIGEGAELRAPLAIAIVGGLLSATVLTLIVVPVLYQMAAHLAVRVDPVSINRAR